MGKLSLSSNVTALEQCTASQHEIYNSLDTNFPIALSADAEDRDGQKREKVPTFCALKTTIGYGPRTSLIMEQ